MLAAAGARETVIIFYHPDLTFVSVKILLGTIMSPKLWLIGFMKTL